MKNVKKSALPLAPLSSTKSFSLHTIDLRALDVMPEGSVASLFVICFKALQTSPRDMGSARWVNFADWSIRSSTAVSQ
eukprot:4091960-Ditylum_brightwellii.AAC.1